MPQLKIIRVQKIQWARTLNALIVEVNPSQTRVREQKDVLYA
jgi:hypothetical protein